LNEQFPGDLKLERRTFFLVSFERKEKKDDIDVALIVGNIPISFLTKTIKKLRKVLTFKLDTASDETRFQLI